MAPENRRVYFGVDRLPGDTTRCENLIDDLRICPKCSGKLTYVYRRYHHIGKCVCPDCGFRSPESDYLATDVDMEKGAMALREGGEEHPYRLISDSVPNLYNMVTVIAVLRQLGYSHEATSGLHEPCGGGGHPAHGGAGGEREAGAADVQGEERTGPGPEPSSISPSGPAPRSAVDDELSGGRPTTGRRTPAGSSMRTSSISATTAWCSWCVPAHGAGTTSCRLLMAGVPEERIVCEPDEFRAAELLRYTPGDDVYILYGTDSLALSYKVYDHMKEEAARRTQGGAEKEGQA